MTGRFSIDYLLDRESLTDSVPFGLSPDGGLLTFSLTAKRRERPLAKGSLFTERGVPVGITGSQVVVLDTRTGETERPFRDYRCSWGGVFSPDGRYLAAFVEDEQALRLGLWERQTHRVRIFSDVSLSVSFRGFEVVRWTPDSRRIVCKLASEVAAEGRSEGESACTNTAGVEVFSNPKTPRPDGGDSENDVTFGECLGDLGTIDVERGAVRRLFETCPFLVYLVAPDGHAAAVLRLSHIDYTLKQAYGELITVPLDGASPKILHTRVATNSHGHCVSWSPDSKWICFVDKERGQNQRLCIVPAKSGSPEECPPCTDLTPEGLQCGGHDEPVWSGDGESVFCAGGGSLWRIPTDGRPGEKLIEEGVLFLTRPSHFAKQARKVHIVLADGGGESASVVRVHSDDGKTETVCRIPFRPVGGSQHYHSVSADGTTFYLAGRDADSRVGIHTLGVGFTEERPPYRFDTEMNQVELAKSQIVHYEDAKGNPRKAELYLPPEHQADTPCPLVVEVYGGTSVGTVPMSDPLYELLCAAGVAVLRPEIPMEFGNPMPQIPQQVIPAIDHAIEMGVADPERIGLYGYSYGSYSVLALLVQTDRFCTAAITAPLCNLTTAYALDVHWCEKGQGRLGCAPWEDPNVYVNNSPLFFMDRIDAPILIISIGESDLSANQDMQIFHALQRLDKRVELRRYEKGDHSLCSLGPLDLSDCYTRILEWYMEYLVNPAGSETGKTERI